MRTRYVGTLHKTDAAIDKIKELTTQGYSEEQIYAVANNDDALAQLRRQTFVALDGKGEEGFLERFKGLFFDEQTKQNKIFKEMGFSEQEANRIYNDMNDGGIAIFVDDIDPDVPVEGHGVGDVEDTERDSAAQMTDSGEILSSEDLLQPRDANAGTVPRINTDNL